VTTRSISLAALNGMSDDDFVGALSGIFEHSPWIPAACLARRPFGSVEALHQRMVEIVQAAPGDAKSRLLKAHPELAAKTTGATALTAESTAEQASLGLDRLADDESERFESLNRRYRDSFGFPFIIAVRGQRDRQAILRAIETRLGNTQAGEIDAAIAEVAKIAWFRLSDLVGS
jgi:2-oxo-4-hydroxy-4-carboxy-5-ureidoimidazoline decarboxylase